jgi:hypothetical protein
MSPDAAYVIEQPHLVPLPDVPPPVYELLERSVDLHGYVSVDTNRYSVPERYVGKSVSVTKTPVSAPDEFWFSRTFRARRVGVRRHGERERGAVRCQRGRTSSASAF